MITDGQTPQNKSRKAVKRQSRLGDQGDAVQPSGRICPEASALAHQRVAAQKTPRIDLAESPLVSLPSCHVETADESATASVQPADREGSTRPDPLAKTIRDVLRCLVKPHSHRSILADDHLKITQQICGEEDLEVSVWQGEARNDVIA